MLNGRVLVLLKSSVGHEEAEWFEEQGNKSYKKATCSSTGHWQRVSSPLDGNSRSRLSLIFKSACAQ
jgi:hypothetical protein